jgi:hypothetical protein
MIVFPKLPALRGRRATYEVNGYVSSQLPHGGYWPAGEPGGRFPGARLHVRTNDGTHLELQTLNFVRLHGAARCGEISLQKFDNNGYRLKLKSWKKSVEGWN